MILSVAYYLATFLCAMWLDRRTLKHLKDTDAAHMENLAFYHVMLKSQCEAMEGMSKERVRLSEERTQLQTMLEVRWEALLQMKVGQVTGDLTPVMKASIQRMAKAAQVQKDDLPAQVRMADAEKMVDESFKVGAP